MNTCVSLITSSHVIIDKKDIPFNQIGYVSNHFEKDSPSCTGLATLVGCIVGAVAYGYVLYITSSHVKIMWHLHSTYRASGSSRVADTTALVGGGNFYILFTSYY